MIDFQKPRLHKKILILEDEAEIAHLMAKRLEKEGYQPIVALDGLDGLKKIAENAVDLIILDLNIPRVSGIEFYNRLCSKKTKVKSPVLVVTGRPDMESMFREFDVDGFILKPFTHERLMQEVQSIFKKQFKNRSDGSRRTITIVDDNLKELEKIVAVFATAGYKVNSASTATIGLEKIINSPPDMALINLGLIDIPGDVLIFKLQSEAKTKHLSYVLYSPKNHEHHKEVLSHFSEKSGVAVMCEYNDPAELLESAIAVFQQLEIEELERKEFI